MHISSATRPPRRTLTRLSAAALSAAGVLSAAAALPAAATPTAPGPAGTASGARAAAVYPNLTPRPPMGWNNWSYYMCDIDEKVILGNARALVKSGLAAKGYDTVTVDDCWMLKQRDARGNLVPDPARFPRGMAYVGRELHRMGLKFGIYEDVGKLTCEKYPGSFGHYQQDADLFAKWKVDYLKMDGCNLPTAPGRTKEQTYQDAYRAVSQALRKTGRDIVFSVSAPAYFQYDGDRVWHQVIRWSSQVGNLWREGRDIAVEKHSGARKWSSIKYNYAYNAKLASFQRPGRWNDPDFLLAGDSGLSTRQIQSQMALWAMMAAPLISSTDLTKISPAALRVLGNRDVIAVDQDPKGVQGRVVQQGPGYDVLSKPLRNGDRAVALFNSGDTPRTLSTTAMTAGLPRAATGRYELRDLVTRRTSRTDGKISVRVPAHATVLYRVRPVR
ncbi:glycoside hydrolase family 27 protein [Streptomyces chrestomyceticus]|uniref:glycoside hydrolase family 27 protein n=1 Tax=Streptomyces chrestomyceticus TaxID=68185 RepID=UPI0035A82EFD